MRKKKQKHDLTLLKSICERDKCIINFNNYQKLNRDTKIIFICGTTDCNEEGEKMFRYLNENSGGFCNKCSVVNFNNKVKKTSLEKYGVEHAMQTQETKDKLKDAMFNKYGAEHTLQVKEFKDKYKKTCIEKYGHEHPMKVEEFKEKSKQTCLDKYCVDNPMKLEEFREKSKETCLEKYGVEYTLQVEEFRDKSKQTMLEKYGVDHPMKVNEIKEKIKQKCLEKYGFENPFQSEEVKEKIKITCMEKFGVENPSQSIEIKNKKIETCLKNFGVEYSFQSLEVKEKSKITCLKLYGVEYAIQNAIIAEKAVRNSYKYKEYIFPCNSIVKIQGYENFALDVLINDGYNYNDIYTKKTDVPEIWYKIENKNHRYYCDIFIEKENKLIEVKSVYTYEYSKDINILKKNACIEKGYNFEFWIFDKKGNKIELITENLTII